MAVESKKITRSDLKKVFWRSLTFQMSWCYERMQAQGFCATIIPILKKIYTKKEDLTLALKRHLEFFNTCPNYGGYPILGITVALEEQQADPDMIRGIKTALMGPLAGLGDTMMWVILGPLLFSIAATYAMQGSIFPLIMTQIIFISWNFFVKWKLLTLGYERGVELATGSQELMSKITFGAGIMGLVIVGALIPTIIGTTTPLAFTIGEYSFVVQEVLDQLLPSLIPVGLVAFCYYLVRVRRWPPARTVMALFIGATILGALNIIQ